jgi:hypothetical protein
MSNQQEHGSLSSIVAKREVLLNKLKENRDKHNAIYDAAVSGYYLKIADELDFKKSVAEKLILEYDKKKKLALEKQQFSSVFKVSFNPTQFSAAKPESHVQDYDKAILMLELSIYDSFNLTGQEFERYVMNNWEWKNSFISNATPYVTGFYQGTGVSFGGYSGLALSGCVQSF